MFLVSESQAGNDMSDPIKLCLMLKMTIHEYGLCNESASSKIMPKSKTYIK